MTGDIIIKNGYVYDITSDSFKRNDILIKNGVIAKISNNINLVDAYIMDATNHVIMPGFINTHIHFGEYFVNGYQGKLSTMQYIKYAEDFNDKNKLIKDEIWKKSADICIKEALRHGETTLVGIRGWNYLERYMSRLYMGYPLMNSNKLKEYLNDFYTRFESFEDTDLNKYYIFLHSLLTVDIEIIKKLSKYIKDKNIFLGVHVSESEYENDFIKNKYGMSPLRFLYENELLYDRTLLVHCCYLNDDDIELVRKTNASISINPNSNLKLKNKVPDIDKFEGINLCIGTDGIATNGNLNIINDCKTLGLMYDIDDSKLIQMLTINPAAFLGNNIGKVESGYKADLNIYDLSDYRIVRKETFINNLIYSSEILPRYVLVNGEFVVEEYKNKTKIKIKY